jgi:SNF2 family DNA or RNA helicase|nr:MAG TPA: Chromatin remodeling complex ATPase [Bacteriophage sp.]
MIKLYLHQSKALAELKGLNKCALYWDMGLGKTFGGSEKMMQLGAKVNLVICQKSKIRDWIEHFKNNYVSQKFPMRNLIFDLTDKKQFDKFITYIDGFDHKIGIINYELAFRRPELAKLKDFTLMLDESSLIQNENSKRSKFILKKLQPKNVILLSGTPTGGKYERLWSQLHLLGWNIKKKTFYNQYVDYHYEDNEGFPLMIIDGYKNEERLKRKMRQHGCHFLKTDEVFDLPEQIHQTIGVQTTKDYRIFRKDCIVNTLVGDDYSEYIELVGDTTLTKMLYERQLCGQYNPAKLEAFRDLVESTNDRLIVFYNFNDELEKLSRIAWENHRPVAVVNGKQKDLLPYENAPDSITFIQYQAGAMGLNLQKANKIVYFTPPLSSELFEQSKKRIHRIGQEKTCFYYYLTCKGSIEEKIYRTLAMRRDYTDKLFEESNN